MQVPSPIKEVSIFDVRRFVMRDTRISSLAQRAIIYEILNFDGFMEKGTIQCSKKHLAQELGINRKTINRAASAAEQLGYWKQEQRKVKGNHYAPTKFHIDWNLVRRWVRQVHRDPLSPPTVTLLVPQTTNPVTPEGTERREDSSLPYVRKN